MNGDISDGGNGDYARPAPGTLLQPTEPVAAQVFVAQEAQTPMEQTNRPASPPVPSNAVHEPLEATPKPMVTIDPIRHPAVMQQPETVPPTSTAFAPPAAPAVHATVAQTIDVAAATKQYLSYFHNDLDAAIHQLHTVSETLRTTPRRIIDGPTVVRVEGVSKHYKNGKQKLEVLKEVSLEIKQGEFVALTGASGSGKSTLLQLIGALDRPSKGKIVVNNQDVSRLSDAKLSVFRNQTIGFIFQFFYLQPFLNMKTNIEVPAMFAHQKRAKRHGRADELANAVGLADRLRHLPNELSGGQMQRVAIARALFNRPKILLADEPTGNLDSTNSAAIIDLFEQVRSTFGTTIIIVTHDRKIANRTDREIIMHDGTIR